MESCFSSKIQRYYVKPSAISRMKTRLTSRIVQHCHSECQIYSLTSAIVASLAHTMQKVTEVERKPELESDVGGSVMVVSMTQFLDLEMDLDEERPKASTSASSVAPDHSIADWDPPLTPWPIPEPIYNKTSCKPLYVSE